MTPHGEVKIGAYINGDNSALMYIAYTLKTTPRGTFSSPQAHILVSEFYPNIFDMQISGR